LQHEDINFHCLLIINRIMLVVHMDDESSFRNAITDSIGWVALGGGTTFQSTNDGASFIITTTAASTYDSTCCCFH
jgi:hypothetical protein